METDSGINFKILHDAIQNRGYTLVEETAEEFSKRKEVEIHTWQHRLVYKGVLGVPLLIFAMSDMMQGTSISIENILIATIFFEDTQPKVFSVS